MSAGLRYFNAWLALGLLLIAVDIYLSLLPAAGGASVMPDKLAHFLVYFTIAFWFANLFPRALGWVFFGAVALGGVLEILQGLGEIRHAEWLDLLANATGATFGCLAGKWAPVNLFQWFERRLSPNVQ